jgi:hypothetical protein
VTLEKLSKDLEELSERVSIQEMTLKVIKEVADRLEEKLLLVSEREAQELPVIDISDGDVEKIRKWIAND